MYGWLGLRLFDAADGDVVSLGGAHGNSRRGGAAFRRRAALCAIWRWRFCFSRRAPERDQSVDVYRSAENRHLAQPAVAQQLSVVERDHRHRQLWASAPVSPCCSARLLVVVGVVLISWKPEAAPSSYRWWHVLYSMAAGFLAGIAFPLRRYGLTMTNEPVFFGFVVAIVSLLGTMPYTLWTRGNALWFGILTACCTFFCSGFLKHSARCSRLMALDPWPGRDRVADRCDHAAF